MWLTVSQGARMWTQPDEAAHMEGLPKERERMDETVTGEWGGTGNWARWRGKSPWAVSSSWEMSVLQGGNLWVKCWTSGTLAVIPGSAASLRRLSLDKSLSWWLSIPAGEQALLLTSWGCCESRLVDAFAVWCIKWGQGGTTKSDHKDKH